MNSLPIENDEAIEPDLRTQGNACFNASDSDQPENALGHVPINGIHNFSEQ
jgi:hypothetical protein